MAIALTIEADSLMQNRSGAIVGRIYFRSNGLAFPDNQWSDFPVVVLAWWLDALGRLLEGADNESLPFMDGPYRVELLRSKDVMALRFVEDKGEKVVVAEAIADQSEVLATVLMGAATVLKEADAKSWSSREIEELRASYKRVARVQ